MSNINTGLADNARRAVAAALNNVLADTYALYLKTHSYHWNVTGPQFHTLHVLFEEQYREMWAALDEIAERVRALGVYAPASGKAFSELTVIDSADKEPPAAEKMVENLLKDHETLIRRAREALATAEEASDPASEDLLTQRIQTHEKTAWMLRSLTA
ncbi:Dps family protein [Amphiplicatus metriothermophilus]|uniref:Starvation-inducible DNA-binding protein n=1 Tax=Amphiplicatus metriothermophilus TaxID=1519374 RepID=A0A239PRA3_9PROT|nr:DNA starvation/stationary phase protection protein [Amphiplicatus metriothermophilus]MBB5518422.1 starvation-inducible DNA-binding protein [Amphiplicatus metriothermophilus]SNT72416.1 starvation-inducible DNA-binding protein [Amphiplicatus metriothermophilus]